MEPKKLETLDGELARIKQLLEKQRADLQSAETERAQFEEHLRNLLVTAPNSFCLAIVATVLDDGGGSDDTARKWLRRIKDDELARVRTQFRFLAETIRAGDGRTSEEPQSATQSLAQLAAIRTREHLQLRYVDTRLEDAVLSDLRNTIWTFFRYAQEALDMALSDITRWALKGLPLYHLVGTQLIALPEDDPRVAFLRESGKLGGLASVFEPPSWMFETYVRANEVKANDWFFDVDYELEGEELKARTEGYRRYLGLDSGAPRMGDEQVAVEFLGSALKPISEMWPLVQEKLGVSRAQAALLVERQLLNMEADLYLDDEWSGLWRSRGKGDAVRELIADCCHSEFAKGESENESGWNRFRLAPSDFAFALEAICRIHQRTPPSLPRQLPPLTVPRGQTVNIDDLADRLTQKWNADFREAFDFIWATLCRRTDIELFDLSSDPASSLGAAGWVHRVADLTCMNEPARERYELRRYGLTREDASCVENDFDRHKSSTRAAQESPPTTRTPPGASLGGWPWGAHHTELLGHLQAAAERFWKNYDPADFSTAPTNDEVSAWLRARDQRVSDNIAKAMATILRPKDIPPGPRK